MNGKKSDAHDSKESSRFASKMGQTLRSRSQNKKIMVPTERSYQREYSCEISKL